MPRPRTPITKVRIIKVSRQSINKGKPGDTESCPVALACKRVLKHTHSVSVADDITVQMPRDGNYYTMELPKKVRRFMDRFDDGASVKPFSFRLHLQ